MALIGGFARRKFGILLLGIWLILTGLLPLLSVRLSPTYNTALAVLAAVAGLLILIDR